MFVTVRVIDGAQADEHVHLSPGKSVTVGRSSESDFVIGSDRTISRQHFKVACSEHECHVEDLGSKSGTFLNDDQVDAVQRLRSADVVSAGRTRFLIEIAAGTELATMPLDAPVSVEDIPPELEVETDEDGFAKLPLPELMTRAEFDDDAKSAAGGCKSASEVVDGMMNQKRYLEAFRTIGHALPKRESVWWSAQCVRSLIPKLSRTDESAITAAEAWCAEPTEENRRAAESAAAAAGHETAAAWVSMGATWSCGSMSPPDAPVVPPGAELTGKATSGAVLMAVVANEPEKAETKYEVCQKMAYEVASRKNRWLDE